MLLFLAGIPKSYADVEWKLHPALKFEAIPRDTAVSLNGKRIYVLTDNGNILIYSPEGKLEDKIDVGYQVDRISAGPREDILLLTSTKNKTVQLLTIDFIKRIDISGSPFKGPKDAPVVIVIFSEFQ